MPAMGAVEQGIGEVNQMKCDDYFCQEARECSHGKDLPEFMESNILMFKLPAVEPKPDEEQGANS